MPDVILKTGMKAKTRHITKEDYLATSWKNDVPVLATPILVWLAELACMEATDGALAPGEMTVGYGHDLKHQAATPAGWEFEISAVLTQVNDNLLTFEVSARDEMEEIFKGTHIRAIVNKEKFIAKLQRKTARGPQHAVISA